MINCCNNRPVIKPISPIIEPTQTHVVEKQFYVNVPHIKPIHTHVVNKVQYNHHIVPQYSCSESTVEENYY